MSNKNEDRDLAAVEYILDRKVDPAEIAQAKAEQDAEQGNR